MTTENVGTLYRWIKRIQALNPSERECLRYFAYLHVSYGGGPLYPSIHTVARRLGKSERTTRRHIHLLRELGLIKIVNDRRGRSNTVMYRLIESEVYYVRDNPDVVRQAEEIRAKIHGEKAVLKAVLKPVQRTAKKRSKSGPLDRVLRNTEQPHPGASCRSPEDPSQGSHSEDWTTSVPDDINSLGGRIH